MRKFARVSFPDPLRLRYELGHGGDWRLEQDFRVFWTDENGKKRSYTAKAGLITDMASIPGWAQSVVNKEGDKAPASIIHDDIYERQPDGWTRKAADRFLYAGLRASGVGWLEANAMYYAVRIGGQNIWDT